MNKELFSYLFVIIALLVGALYYNNTIQSPIISSLNAVKTSYHNLNQSIKQTFNEHFFQADTIQNLRENLAKYEKNHLVMQELAGEIHDLYNENHSPLKLNTKVELVRTISYQKFGNFNRLWMEVPDYNSSKIYGLTYKELAAGIIISKNGKALALLNQDIKSAYAVYIGHDSAPGIVHGNNDDLLIVNFIPAWSKINKGDEVITSGLDNIFIKGLKVGRVISVTSSQGYQNAIIEPYYKSNEPSYFHMIRSIR
ncbi:rod shape-determining protein MreC [Sulfurimonas sp. SAG-AH-194-C20]|nr:rod shape-determining protein MreC [Sulfurimonas sp. SAG-AH-194-C20]MDF1879152.1 rod shape-determining protein MreC [Sulfurimonas sp. SAG-AH-194-C20]